MAIAIEWELLEYISAVFVAIKDLQLLGYEFTEEYVQQVRMSEINKPGRKRIEDDAVDVNKFRNSSFLMNKKKRTGSKNQFTV